MTTDIHQVLSDALAELTDYTKLEVLGMLSYHYSVADDLHQQAVEFVAEHGYFRDFDDLYRTLLSQGKSRAETMQIVAEGDRIVTELWFILEPILAAMPQTS